MHLQRNLDFRPQSDDDDQVKLRREPKLSELARKYLDPEALNKRLLHASMIQSGRIDFIFVFVRAETPQQLAERLGRVADAGHEHEATVHDILGPMVVMAFGTHPSRQHSGSRQQLVSDLRQQFGTDIKIVHGAADGHFGNFGNERRISFTFTFPHFETALATLGNLEFGQTEELQN